MYVFTRITEADIPQLEFFGYMVIERYGNRVCFEHALVGLTWVTFDDDEECYIRMTLEDGPQFNSGGFIFSKIDEE